jgi:hypothetical protein
MFLTYIIWSFEDNFVYLQKNNLSVMRFFQEYNGFIFEFNSIGEYFKAVLWRILGRIVGLVLLGLFFLLLYWLGSK